MSFDQKAWIDAHVIPWLRPTRLSLYSVLWNHKPGEPQPAAVVVFTLAGLSPPPGPEANDNAPDPADDPWAQVARAAAAEQAPPINGVAAADPAAWPIAGKQLLEAGFRFDYLREMQMVKTDHGLIQLFGGDGTPMPDKDGRVSMRLWRQIGPTQLIVVLGAKYASAPDGIAAIKSFFALFDGNAVDVAQKFAAPFGAA